MELPKAVLWPISSSSNRGREHHTDKAHVVSTRRWVPTNCVSSLMMRPTTEPVIVNFSVPSDFLVEVQVSGLGTVHPLLTLSFISTWFLPLQEEDVICSGGICVEKNVCVYKKKFMSKIYAKSFFF